MARVLAIDYGGRRLGVAVGDDTIGVATGLCGFEFRGRKELNRILKELVEEQQPEIFIVGYPLRMDGTPGEQCEAVDNFVNLLRGWFGVRVILWDERLTSSEAVRIQRKAGRSDRQVRREGLVDRAAATLLLQSWLDSPDKSGIQRDSKIPPEGDIIG